MLNKLYCTSTEQETSLSVHLRLYYVEIKHFHFNDIGPGITLLCTAKNMRYVSNLQMSPLKRPEFHETLGTL